MGYKNFCLKYNALDDGLYNALKKSFPNELLTTQVRSHADHYVTDVSALPPPWQTLMRDFLMNENFWRYWLVMMGLEAKYKFKKDYLEGIRSFGEFKEEPFLYTRVDIGVGLKGYGKVNGGMGVHIDNPQRIISGLLYFCDQDDMNGGEFDICNKDGSLYQRINIRENLMILSEQNNEAWHKVNPLISGERRYVYFALSSSVPWRKEL